MSTFREKLRAVLVLDPDAQLTVEFEVDGGCASMFLEGEEIEAALREPDDVEALRARVSTLVESEARAVAGEKAARAALAKIDVKRIRELAYELRRGQWTHVAEHILLAIAAPSSITAPTAWAAEPCSPVVDHGPNGVGC